MGRMQTQPCKARHMALQDTLEVIKGKWKLVIIATLLERKMRFKELSREIGISPRILSKELQELEMNRLVKRTVFDTKPVAVEYEMTDYACTLREVIQVLTNWGTNHRREIIGTNQVPTTQSAIEAEPPDRHLLNA